MPAVGVDIGAGKILAGRVDESGEVEDSLRLVTPRRDASALVEAVVGLVTRLGCGGPVGVGVAGLVTEAGELRYGPNLVVERLLLRSLLEDELSVPVVVCNDAEAALWAEAAIGSAKGARNVAMLTLGTGVGGAVLDTGRFVRGHGFGGELGHLIINDGGRPCGCGSTGCLEAYASGTAIGKRAHERLQATSTPSVLRDADFNEIDVSCAARDGDAFAIEIVREAGRWLGVGVTSIVNAFDPEMVVLGGGVTDAVGQILVPPATEVMRTRLMGAQLRRPPDLVTAVLGDNAGMIGAGLLAIHNPAAARSDSATSPYRKEAAP
jgi:glucokinase